MYLRPDLQGSDLRARSEVVPVRASTMFSATSSGSQVATGETCTARRARRRPRTRPARAGRLARADSRRGRPSLAPRWPCVHRDSRTAVCVLAGIAGVVDASMQAGVVCCHGRCRSIPRRSGGFPAFLKCLVFSGQGRWSAQVRGPQLTTYHGLAPPGPALTAQQDPREIFFTSSWVMDAAPAQRPCTSDS